MFYFYQWIIQIFVLFVPKVEQRFELSIDKNGMVFIPSIGRLSLWNTSFKKAKEIGIKGFIVPDLPPEEGEEYLQLAKQYEIAPIQIFAPTSTDDRMRELSNHANGFIYCVARRGVTGSQTSFDEEFHNYLSRCRAATELPLAVGFGISNKEDVDVLTDKADIAVIGTATIKLVEEKGAQAVGTFIAGLR